MLKSHRRTLGRLLAAILILPILPLTASAAEAGRRKVFLLGLDGATWRVLLPMLETGELPNLQRLMKDGAYGTLFSQAAYSPVSWNSILTGFGKREHGISGLYLESDLGVRFADPPSRAERRFHLVSMDRRKEPIWNIMDRAGLRVGVLGYLTTYPADPINGIFVSGDTSPNLLRKSSLNFQLEEIAGQTAGGLRHYQGTALGTTVELREREPGLFQLGFPDDPTHAFGEIRPGQRTWIELRLDGKPGEFFHTMTELIPRIRQAPWKKAASSRFPALELSIPSGVAPRHHYKRRNRPLFVLLDSTSGRRYDRVRFSYHQDPSRLESTAEIYGITVRGEVLRAGASESEEGEVRLTPTHEGGIPLSLRWETTSQPGKDSAAGAALGPSREQAGVAIDPQLFLSLGEGEGISGKETWDLFMDWVAQNRRSMTGSGTAFLGTTQGMLTLKGPKARLQTGPVYDSFRQPTYRFFHPPDLLADLDLGAAGTPPNIEIYRNQEIKEVLFDHLFDPDQFDAFLLCFTATDLTQHLPWNSPDPRDLELSRLNERILERWRRTDAHLGTLLDRLGPEWVVVAASDHGFHKVFKRREIDFNWNQLLLDLELLTVEAPPEPDRSRLSYQPARNQSYRLELTYHCAQPPSRNLNPQLVLQGADGKPIHRIRLHPGHGSFPTSLWKPDSIVQTERQLAFKETVPAGEYELWLDPRAPQGSRMKLGELTIPDEPHSVIPPEGLFRIGDVEVVQGAEAARILADCSREPVSLGGGIRLVDWKLVPEPSRYMGYLQSCAPRIRLDRSRVAYYRVADQDGKRVGPEGIYLLGEPKPDDPDLLEELAELARSARVVELDRPVFKGPRVDTRRRAVVAALDSRLFLPEQTVHSMAFRCYDATWTLQYTFRGRTVTRPLRELLKNTCVGFHENEGVYIISGADIADSGLGPQAQEWDIAPTVLQLLDLQIPAGLSGRPIGWQNAESMEPAPGEEVLSNEELYEQLRSIGYLGNM